MTPPREITVGVLSCIPSATGYFDGSFDALRLCLKSLRAHADRDFDLLVVDNASTREVRQYLLAEHEAGRIDYLLLNQRNVGRPNGVRQILSAAPGDLVFYSDGDIYYREGWLSAHLEVLRAFPDAGLIGGYPIRKLTERHTQATFRWLEAHRDDPDLTVEEGSLIPDAWSVDYGRSVGHPDPVALVEQWRELKDVRVVRNGVAAWVGASHMQFLMPRKLIEQLPHHRFDRLMKMNHLVTDDAVDDAGKLRLSTSEPVVYHIGNQISEPWLVAELNRLTGADKTRQPPAVRRGAWLWRRHRVRQWLQRIHSWTFRRLHQDPAIGKRKNP